MAQIEETNTKKTRRRVAKPDMTPMVDLGFLLITFFMFTTKFTNPNMMKLVMPDKTDGTSELNSKNTLTLILGENDRIYWHQQDTETIKPEDIHETNYSTDGLRKDILEKQSIAPKPENFTVIIKPTNESSFKNAVDALDEMEITNMKRYALVDLFPNELMAYNEKKTAQIMKIK